MSTELVDRIRLAWVVLAEAGPPAEADVTTHPLQEEIAPRARPPPASPAS